MKARVAGKSYAEAELSTLLVECLLVGLDASVLLGAVGFAGAELTVELVSLFSAVFSFLGCLKSVSYQPCPLRTKLV